MGPDVYVDIENGWRWVAVDHHGGEVQWLEPPMVICYDRRLSSEELRRMTRPEVEEPGPW